MSNPTKAAALRGTVAALACAAAVALTSAPATAQTTSLAAQRDAVFARMLADPANRDLMRDYARLSVEMREFEAAVATLERLVDLEPTNSAARMELGIAYFSLGNYDLAEYHLAAAQAGGALTPAQSAQVARYRAESAARDEPSTWSGHVALGYAWNDQDFGENEGFFGTASLDWRLDLGGPFVAQWVTEAELATYEPEADDFFFSALSRQELRIRTGPEFRLTGDTYGPRLQPYFELGAIRFPDASFQDEDRFIVGVAYQNPHNEVWTTFADLSYGEAELIESGGEYTFHDLEFGVVYRPSRDTRLRMTLSAGGEDWDFVDISTTGARLEAQHEFDAPFDLSRRWVVGSFLDVDWIDSEFSFNDSTRIMTGLMVRTFFTDALYLETSATHGITVFDTPFLDDAEETVVSMMVGWEF
ncbi:tetratricopeptide repeat protein [Maritalea mobilis]|uniref:tetratricopeptide repeat protein n=1 Tax=Maritalea mobilis TaxID=483324 RepID=UPI001C97C023|nr:tetratricopeptide repeat protein [Maritalea mobilis]MBY6199879.1 tetratricopeptide repeat protein [Maritalea mobilis]